jgi:3-oxoacyl-[acyl-carrier-protein] synthase-3
VPERVVTNDELASFWTPLPAGSPTGAVSANASFAAPDQTNADLALAASQQALARAALEPDALGMIVVATLSPDHFFPGVSASLQARLGVTRPVPAFDLHAQCGGFVYGLAWPRDFSWAGSTPMC